MNLKISVILSVTCLTIFLFSLTESFATDKALSEQDLGAEEILLEGGTPGDVPFPHRMHQENLEDCKLCHDLFPQKKGAIEKLKAEDKLKRKQVMNFKCTKCHRDGRRDGKDSGPITCSGCHSEK